MNKQVIIKRLQLVNFKGLRNVAIEFSDDVTTISGHNGTGKTTIKDAGKSSVSCPLKPSDSAPLC